MNSLLLKINSRYLIKHRGGFAYHIIIGYGDTRHYKDKSYYKSHELRFFERFRKWLD